MRLLIRSTRHFQRVIVEDQRSTSVFQQRRAMAEEWQAEHSTSLLWRDGEMFASVAEPQLKSQAALVIPSSTRKVAH
jgi:3-polyprenyl-4-hydroxybenzoate decarboxylase